MCTCEISDQIGPRQLLEVDVGMTPEVRHPIGERGVGHHRDAAELDQHAGVAEPREWRHGRLRLRPRRPQCGDPPLLDPPSRRHRRHR